MAHYRQTFKLAMPVVLGQAGHITVSVADSMMVGRTGAIPLAAVSLATGLFSIMLVIGLGFAYGLTPLVAAADGRHDQRESSVLLKNSLLINVLLAVVLVIVFWQMLPLMHLLKQKPEVIEQAIPFMQLLVLSLLPLMFFSAFKQFAEGLSDTLTAMYITLVANAINILLNYTWVYGHWGFEAMGIKGSGLATFTARCLMAVAMFGYVWFSKKFRPYRFGWNMEFISWAKVKHLLYIGVPVSMQMTFEVAAFSTAAVLVGQLGSNELAAHQIALNMAAVTYMMASGLGAAATVRVGNGVGSGNLQSSRMAGFSALHIVVAFMGLMGIIFTIGRFWLPTFYIENEDVIRVASSLLIIAAIFQISDGVQVVCLGALRGLSDVKIPTAITLVAYWILGLPIGYALAVYANMGVEGIWYGLLLGLTIAAILLTLRFNHISKQKIIALTKLHLS